LRHGPVDALQVKERTPGSGEASGGPSKECPECQALIHAAYSTCPDCGYEFPPPEKQKHDAQAHAGGVLSGEVTQIEYDVKDVLLPPHPARCARRSPAHTTGRLHGQLQRAPQRMGLHRASPRKLCEAESAG